MGPAIVVPIIWFSVGAGVTAVGIKIIADMIAKNYDSGKINRSPPWKYDHDGSFLDLTLYHGTDS